MLYLSTPPAGEGRYPSSLILSYLECFKIRITHSTDPLPQTFTPATHISTEPSHRQRRRTRRACTTYHRRQQARVAAAHTFPHTAQKPSPPKKSTIILSLLLLPALPPLSSHALPIPHKLILSTGGGVSSAYALPVIAAIMQGSLPHNTQIHHSHKKTPSP